MAKQSIKDSKARKDAIVPPTTTTPLISNISFNFKYLTKNKAHNFAYFNGDMRKSHDAYEALVERMQVLCCIDMNWAKQVGKIAGCEPIPYKALSSSMQMICDGIEIISKDSSLSVFRFSQNDYRLLCKTDLDHSNLLYVVGFDFDYSAYDHG